MSSDLKPITLYGAKLGPNPLKVTIILSELGIPWELHPIALTDVKQPSYVAINPNGRLPSIVDPNTGITLWESGAIIEYLIANYDKDHKLCFPAQSKEDWLTKQYLFYQTTGQGPYYGQGMWFTLYAPEKIPLALERYQNEAKRVTGVLESVLEGKQWLVGDKCTFADLAFVSWQIGVPIFVKDTDFAKEFPNVEAWMGRMKERPVVKKILDDYFAIRAQMLEQQSKKAKGLD